MNIRTTVSRGNRLIQSATERLAFVAPLATRIVIGLAFVHTGIGKFRHFDNVVGFFADLGIPLPVLNAGLVATMETVGGAMLVLGLFTRFFAGGLSTTMVVALLTADTADFLSSWTSASQLSPTDVTSFTFLLFLIWLLIYGAGSLSLDALLRRILRTAPVESAHPIPARS